MMKVSTFMAIAIAAAVAPVAAQDMGLRVSPQQAGEPRTMLDAQKMAIAEKIAVEGMQTRMAVESRITTGAPYAGEAVNESVQVLADGNRISKRTVTRVYRDSEGRTRRESIGKDGQVESISITDPVAHVTYSLDPRTKEAYRNSVVMVTPDGIATFTMAQGPGLQVGSKTPDGVVTKIEGKEEKEAAEVRARATAGARSGGSGRSGEPVATTFAAGERGGFVAATMPSLAVPMSAGKTTKEDLGQQLVEGVMAAGSRATMTIEAGAIGNEQPLQIVSEQWFSADLQLLILTKHSDPRAGESTFRLTNITQAEQPRSLFELPPDYTLKESLIRPRKEMQ
jgi:hypothetical protein